MYVKSAKGRAKEAASHFVILDDLWNVIWDENCFDVLLLFNQSRYCKYSCFASSEHIFAAFTNQLISKLPRFFSLTRLQTDAVCKNTAAW